MKQRINPEQIARACVQMVVAAGEQPDYEQITLALLRRFPGADYQVMEAAPLLIDAYRRAGLFDPALFGFQSPPLHADHTTKGE